MQALCSVSLLLLIGLLRIRSLPAVQLFFQLAKAGFSGVGPDTLGVGAGPLRVARRLRGVGPGPFRLERGDGLAGDRIAKVQIPGHRPQVHPQRRAVTLQITAGQLVQGYGPVHSTLQPLPGQPSPIVLPSLVKTPSLRHADHRVEIPLLV